MLYLETVQDFIFFLTYSFLKMSNTVARLIFVS